MRDTQSPSIPHRRERLERLVFAVATLLSAFLLFLVQPLVAKHILPWFGGTPAVWNVCLAFYQSALFFGYLYAHALVTRVSAERQRWVHGALLLVALVLLPVLPSESWKPAASSSPALRIAAMLIANVGLPFALLAASAPLVQARFARRFPGASPFPLYALSNLGSLLALLCFPFALEPWLPISAIAPLWSGGFALASAAVLACLGWSRASAHAVERAQPAHERGEARAPQPRGVEQRVAWLLLPACAVVLLMGVTNRLCLDVASVPLLWVVPLALYLSTFILCFASARQHRPRLYWAIAAISLLGFATLEYADVGLFSRGFRIGAIFDDVSILTALLFSSCMLLHGELERRKPAAAELTSYYLSIAAGGALGGLFTGLLAPLIFDDYHELPLGLALSWVTLGALGRRRASPPAHATTWRYAPALGIAAMVLLSALPPFVRATRPCGVELLRERSFFGVSRVLECNPDQPRRHVKMLINGSTLHGRQLQLPAIQHVPTSYFGPLTAIGMALYDGPLGPDGIDLDGDGSQLGRKIGIIGVGVGMIAGYGRSGDRIVYYEIDPEIVAIARDSGHFDYLAHSRAEIEIVLGDARLSLERELETSGARAFDVLVVDAFSSDAIPTHLLTREAFALYANHLRRGGLLAVHVSNRYLRLAPLVARVGASQGFGVLRVQNRSFAGYSSGKALWVLLSQDPQTLDRLEQQMRARIRDLRVRERTIAIERIEAADLESAPLWTDDYSNILGVLRFAPQVPRGGS